VIECQAEDTAGELKKALASNQMTVIVCKCESGNVKVPVISMNPVVIGDRFMTEVRRRQS
jgi:sulfopyruvate decarboxylase subunit beta